jgi:hypothetical protein
VNQREKQRYERMEQAWEALAKTQAWLDGERDPRYDTE